MIVSLPTTSTTERIIKSSVIQYVLPPLNDHALLQARCGGSVPGGRTAAAVVTAFIRKKVTTGLELERANLRVSAVSMYAVIAALIMNASLTQYSSTPMEIDRKEEQQQQEEKSNDNIMQQMSKRHVLQNLTVYLFKGLTCLTVISGMYSTVLFTLIEIYSQTALGCSLDDVFVQFFNQTNKYRQNGFNSFLVMLASFASSHILSMMLDSEGKFRWILLLPAILLMFVSFLNFHQIMNLATTLIFTQKTQIGMS